MEAWQIRKKEKEVASEREIGKYIQYSFKKNFMLNGREIELYEPPKILGDVFEAIMGGVFMDGGIESVIQVYEHLLAPFVLFTAKFSKKLRKEPKEDFLIYAN